MSLIGRLAPSPTGDLHLGHARTFLLAWWHARSRGARVVLRMEDLDGPRVQPSSVESILRDLEWLGVDWDGPMVLQSSRLEAITAHADALVERGLAYPCVCSRGDVRNAQSAPQSGADGEQRYPGTCRGRFTSVAEAERESGKPAALRFVVPAGTVTGRDGIVGAFAFDVASDAGDFPIARKGGAPAYQLAVVVDDAADGVTEVVRGDDLLASTARQILLQRALGLPSPAWWHVPLVGDETGRRLAKRARDASLGELRARGVDQRAVVGWAARSAGISDVDRASATEVTRVFDMTRVPRTAVRIDVEGLDTLTTRGNAPGSPPGP